MFPRPPLLASSPLVRAHSFGPALPRVVLAVVVIALLLPVSAAGAARDPLAEAEARVTSARRAANEAAEKYDEAQTEYYGLQSEIEAKQATIATTEAEAQKLTGAAQERAIEAYQGGSAEFEIIMDGDDVLDAMRRNELLDRVNEQGNSAVDQLSVVTEELHAQQASLNEQLAAQETVVDDMKDRESDLREKLADAEKAEADLKARLEREKRERELQERLRRARAAASSASSRSSGSSASSGGGRSGQIIVSGSWVCPVPGGSSFSDGWGDPRSGGRRHQGVDMMAGTGSPVVAVVGGTVQTRTGGLGGNAIWLAGSDGNTYYYAHLNDFVGGSRAVSAGELIGHVGNTGNARGGPSHLHFEIHPGGGSATNPYPTTRAHC